MSFGGSYDFDANQLQSGIALDERLHELRDRVAGWLGVPPGDLVHALVAEYAPGTPLGWHRDVPDFETIVGVSLGGHATLRFRPYPDAPATRKVVQLDVAPRSIYKISSQARWGWPVWCCRGPGQRFELHSSDGKQRLRDQCAFRTCPSHSGRVRACSSQLVARQCYGWRQGAIDLGQVPRSERDGVCGL